MDYVLSFKKYTNVIMASTKRALILVLLTSYVTAYNIHIPPVSHIDYTAIMPQLFNLPAQLVNPQVSNPKCYNAMNNKWSNCHSAKPMNAMNVVSNEGSFHEAHLRPRNPVYGQYKNGDAYNTLTARRPVIQNSLRRSFFPPLVNSVNLLPIRTVSPAETLRSPKYPDASTNENLISSNNVTYGLENNYPYDDSRSGELPIARAHTDQAKPPPMSTIPQKTQTRTENIYNDIFHALDLLERKFYAITFDKLTQISPANRKENGISFVQSGLFLLLSLIALSSEVDYYSRQEIEKAINMKLIDFDKFSAVTSEILDLLPPSSNDLKFRWATRLILWPSQTVSEGFKSGPAAALQIHIDSFNGTETPEKIAEILNDMVEKDSGGSIHSTFEEDDLSEGAQAILLNTLYLRGRWRSAPTLLNGSRLFRDTEDAPTRSLRYIRINDIMRYADLAEWDAEAIEIFYATPGLSLLMLVPRRSSLRRLVDHVATTSIRYITRRMHSIRIAVTVPLYTLRMTLLLPNKLQAMGISRLVDTNNTTPNSLTLSHAVQRLMFWAEAGRNAFKDDGATFFQAFCSKDLACYFLVPKNLVEEPKF